MVTQGTFPFGSRDNVVPGSDGAGTVLATGPKVSRFKPGDKVITVMYPHHVAGSLMPHMLQNGLGASADGTLRGHGVFEEQALVKMPRGLTFNEAATLTCAGVTAWNALYGAPGQQVIAGQWVLTLGTGGVSIFGVQLAKAAGARVISTTSSEEKAKLLRKLGADHVINYRETPNWGSVAKELTGGGGVDHVLEIGGPSTLRQSVNSIKTGGVITVMGSVGKNDAANVPTLLDCWMNNITARGIWAGSRLLLEEMCQAVEGNLDKLRPVVDPNVLPLEQLKDAYEYLESGKHQGNVCVSIP